MANWWETFCDGDYLRFWEGAEDRERTAREVASLWSLLGLREGSRVLDASCGYGWIARPLAEQAARVPGVDFSAGLLGEAERRRGGISADRLRYQRLDLRLPLEESGFDVALTVFSSLG